MAYAFDFECMHAYQVGLEVARWMRTVHWPTGTGHLKDQGIRAADSMVLNTAEGRIREGKARRNHYLLAQGSAGEALAVLDIARLPGSQDQQQKLRRVGAMLEALKRNGSAQ